MMYSYSIVAFLLCTSWSLFAQQNISMEAAIKRIQTEHPQIIQQDLIIQQQHLLKEAAKGHPSTGIGYSTEELGAAGSGVHSLYLQQDFNLPQVAKRQAALQDALAQTGEWSKLATQKELERFMGSLYQQLVFLKSQQTIQQELLELYQQLEQIAQKRIEVGETGQLPLLATQSAKQQIQLQQMTTVQQYENQLLQLQQFLLDDTIDGVVDTMLTALEIPAQAIDLAKHPLVQQIDQNIIINQYQEAVIESQLLPQLSTSVQIQVVEQTFPNFGAQIGFNVPLFNKGVKAQVAANKLNAKILEQQKLWQLQQLNSQQKMILKNIQLLQKQVQHFEQVWLPTLQQQQQLNLKMYEVGEIDYLKTLQGLQQIINAKQSYLQILLQLNLNCISYRFLCD